MVPVISCRAQSAFQCISVTLPLHVANKHIFLPLTCPLLWHHMGIADCLVQLVLTCIDFDALTKVVPHSWFTVYHIPGIHTYFLMGFPDRSHMLNSGDQLANRSLKASCRQKAKVHLLCPCMDMVDCKIPPGTPLEMSKSTILTCT